MMRPPFSLRAALRLGRRAALRLRRLRGEIRAAASRSRSRSRSKSPLLVLRLSSQRRFPLPPDAAGSGGDGHLLGRPPLPPHAELPEPPLRVLEPLPQVRFLLRVVLDPPLEPRGFFRPAFQQRLRGARRLQEAGGFALGGVRALVGESPIALDAFSRRDELRDRLLGVPPRGLDRVRRFPLHAVHLLRRLGDGVRRELFEAPLLPRRRRVALGAEALDVRRVPRLRRLQTPTRLRGVVPRRLLQRVARAREVSASTAFASSRRHRSRRSCSRSAQRRRSCRTASSRSRSAARRRSSIAASSSRGSRARASPPGASPRPPRARPRSRGRGAPRPRPRGPPRARGGARRARRRPRRGQSGAGGTPRARPRACDRGSPRRRQP